MKKLILLATFTFCCLTLFAQQNSTQTPENSGIPKSISGGVLNGKAISLPKPIFPAAARAVKASGAVSVQVTIDEEGNVISASAVSGHPLLRQASEQAARAAKFSPTTLSGQLVKITGVIVYNFVADSSEWLSVGKNLGENSDNSLRKASYLLPKDFDTERTNLIKMVESKSTSGVDDLINSIESRLRFNATDIWEFQLGTSIGRIISNSEDTNSLRTNLLKIRQLTDFPPSNIPTARLESMKELANFSNNQKLSEKDKATIIELCNSIN